MKATMLKRRSSGSHRPLAKFCQLRFDVTGSAPKSVTAFSNLKKICENQLINSAERA
jgi:hypothetical protein